MIRSLKGGRPQKIALAGGDLDLSAGLIVGSGGTPTLVSSGGSYTLTVSATSAINQDVTTTGTPQVARLGIGTAADSNTLLTVRGVGLAGSGSSVVKLVAQIGALASGRGVYVGYSTSDVDESGLLYSPNGFAVHVGLGVGNSDNRAARFAPDGSFQIYNQTLSSGALTDSVKFTAVDRSAGNAVPKLKYEGAGGLTALTGTFTAKGYFYHSFVAGTVTKLVRVPYTTVGV